MAEQDPVCDMMVEKDEAAATSTYMGHTYYFCNVACKGQFDANPASYVGLGDWSWTWDRILTESWLSDDR
jgi:Cu+-exporting ATPase